MTGKTTLHPFDPAEVLDTPEARAAYLSDAMAEGDAGEIAHALGVIARATGMAEIAKAAGLGQHSLYKALREDSSPKLDTMLRVMGALGVRMMAVPSSIPEPANPPPIPMPEDKLA